MDRVKNKYIRLYIDQDFSENKDIPLDKDQSNYLINVMRQKEGSIIKVFSNGEEWLATIKYASKKSVILNIKEKVREEVSNNKLNLIFAPIKNSRISYIIEKATELGVSKLIPVITDNSVSKNFNLDRGKLITIEAAEQCERLDIPEINEISNLTNFLKNWDQNNIILFCNEKEEEALISNVVNNIDLKSVTILTGPEGGFSESEINMLKTLPYIISVSLGNNILRAETAVIAALSIIMLHQN